MVTVRPGQAPDVLVLGEVLVELTALEPLRDGTQLRLGFSGDALNAAAAAAAAGAHTCLLARVPDDELGDELVGRVARSGWTRRCCCAARASTGCICSTPIRRVSGSSSTSDAAVQGPA
ncbi:hypothetical protein JNW88_04135 [Micromonospora sp. ATA32]|nr:hypothetical protein [Micromonospora sp. ATA32]